MSIKNAINNIENGEIRFVLNSMIDYIENAYNFHTHSISGGTVSSYASTKAPEVSIEEIERSKIE